MKAVLPIVTCMGRLEHLRQTLPGAVREFGRVVLVDWSCPQGSGEWARRTLGDAVHVETIRGERTFHKTRALNAGLRAAAGLGASWVLVLDADTSVGEGLREACEERALRGQFAIGDRVLPGPRSRHHLGGVLLVARDDIERAGGYDEAFRDYGPEDVEMRCRLRLRCGLRCVDLPGHLLDSLPHSDALRMRHAAQSDVRQATRRNAALLAARVREWTGRDIAAIPEIQDLLIGPGCRMVLPIVVGRSAGGVLRETLPRVADEFGQAVLVDATPSHGAIGVARALAGKVTLLRAPGASRAAGRNLAARQAPRLGADWLFFLDDDVAVQPGLRLACETQSLPRRFAVADRAGGGDAPSLLSVLLVSAIDFARAGSYDEAADSEVADVDMRCRLSLLHGLRALDLPAALLSRLDEAPGATGRNGRTWAARHEELTRHIESFAQRSPVEIRSVPWVRRLFGIEPLPPAPETSPAIAAPPPTLLVERRERNVAAQIHRIRARAGGA